MYHREGTFKGIGGLDLYYQSWHPEGEVRAIVAIVHGLGGHSGLFANVVKHLIPQRYAVYAFDLRGNGRSPGQRGYINAWAEFRGDLGAFLQFIESQEPERPLFAIAHSLGAVIVLDWVLHSAKEASALQGQNISKSSPNPPNLEGTRILSVYSPPQSCQGWGEQEVEGRKCLSLKGIIALAPALGQVGVSPIKVLLGQLLSRVWPHFTLNTGIDLAAGSRDKTVLDAYARDSLRHTRASARLATEFFATVAWIQAHAADWQLPLLILHGGADRVTPPEGGRLFFEAVRCSDKTRKEYPEAYHELHNDLDYQEVLTDVANWLEQHL
ncbi:MAG TPA: lysophospholipase [Cyanobacteria bacterium UBA8803]|nr:lysophospholipase [Cyanobacteria bacterium UBA9273]HBL57418.1 lysophospholipase [Cyanobacteria bacterium UBA8803]